MIKVYCFQAITGLTTVPVRLFGFGWKLFILPISIIGSSLGLVSGSIRLSFRVAGFVLWYWPTMIGLTNSGRNRKPPPVLASEEIDFSSVFESRNGEIHVPRGFPDAVDGFSLQRQFEGSSSPEEEMVTELQSVLEENAPAHVLDTENEDTNNQPLMEEQDTQYRAALEADQFEVPSSPEEIVTQLQTVLEENAPVLVATSLDTTDEHSNNPPLMEEQDTQNGAALEADQANECDMKEDEIGIERESNLSEEEDLQLVFEPEQEPDVIQVLVRLPIGERIGKTFPRTATLQSVYELVDSSGCLDVGSYTLVNFFPRVLYGQDQLSSTLEQLGLHPQTSLFVELNS